MEEIMNHEPVPEEMAQEQTPPVVCIEKTKKKPLWILWVCIGLLVAAATAAAFFLTANLRKYVRAESLLEAGDHAGAAAVFAELEDYKDAAEKSRAVLYDYAESVMEDGNYAEAVPLYEQLGDYEKSQRRVLQCYYMLAKEAIKAEQRDTAIEYLELAGDYTDAAELRLQTIYAEGHALFMAGRYDDAQVYFDRLEGRWPQNGGPHFVTFEDALDYISFQALELPEKLTVAVADMPGTYILRPEFLNVTVQQRLGYQFAVVGYNEKNLMLTIEPSYYPSQRIIQAWKNDDFSKLTEDELETYRKAKSLVAQAQVIDPDPEAVELWIHDWICKNVEYDSPYSYVYPEDFVGLDELTCVGAILNGKANCQGYTDAFCLMGTLAGLDVYIMFGEAGGGHCWNGVRLDGKIYLVDTTFDDTFIQEPEQWSYIWYNNALNLDEYSVDGGTHLFHRVVSQKDLSKTYYTRTESVYEDMDDAAVDLLREYRENGPGVYHGVIEKPDLTEEELYQALADNMSKVGVYDIRYYSVLYTYGEDTYIWTRWR